MTAQVQVANGEATAARESLRRLHQAHPTSSAVALKHADVTRANDPDESLAVVTAWLARADVPKGPSVERAGMLAALARSRASCGQLRSAINALNDAVEMRDAAEEAAEAARLRAKQESDANDARQGSNDDEVAWATKAPPKAQADADMKVLKLWVASELGTVRHEQLWLDDRIAEAQIALASVVVIHDAKLARQIADRAVRSGRMQELAHEAAAQACVASGDLVAAAQHIGAGLKVRPTHGGLLRSFARLLRARGQTQDAVLVATYARGVTSKGKAQATASVRRAYADIRDSVLGAV
jgi:hypothetical protein